MATKTMIQDVIGRFFPEPPSTLLDVGVGKGREAHELKELWLNMLCLGFEPCAEMFEYAAKDFPGVLHPHGCWSHPQQATLSVFGEQSSVYWTPQRRAHDVVLRPLDEHHVFDAILWADVEGAELEVLRGAWRLLRKHVCLVNLEVRQKPLYSGACTEAEIDAFLAAFGFAKALTYNVHYGDDPHHDAVYVKSERERTW